MSRRFLLCLAVAATLSAACSKQHPRGAAGLAILRRVPADTPYVLANLEPWSREQYEQYLADNRATLARAAATMRTAAESGGPGTKLVLALLEELNQDPTLGGVMKLGLSPAAHGALYGLGLLPVARLELSDAAAFDAFIGRAVHKSGVRLPKLTHRGRPYYAYRPTPGLSLLISIERGELVIALAPDAMATRVLDAVRGDVPIGESLAATGALDKLAAAEGFTRLLVGYLDFRQAAALLLDERRPFGREVVTAFGGTLPAASCRAEVESLVALAPRWVLGATEVTARHTAGVMIIELAPLLARELMALRAPVPGVGAPLGEAVLAMGMAGDVGKGINLLKRGAALVGAAPYRCRELAFLNEAAAELARELGQPLPSWVAELRGFTFVLDAVNAGLAMPDIKAYGVLAASDPIQLIDMAKRAMSQLASVNIPPDGRPVPIPGGVLPLMTGHVAMKGQLLGLSLGGGSEVKLVRLMSSAPHRAMPLLSFALDGEKLQAMLKTIGGAFGGATDDATAFGGGVSHVTIEATERGLVLRADQVTAGAAKPTP